MDLPTVLIVMKPNNQFVRGGAQRWVALFFVLVVAVFGFAQAVHMHRGLADESLPNRTTTHCGLCVASHSAVVTTDIGSAPILTHQLGSIVVAEPQLERRLTVFSSFTRPPPAA